MQAASYFCWAKPDPATPYVLPPRRPAAAGGPPPPSAPPPATREFPCPIMSTNSPALRGASSTPPRPVAFLVVCSSPAAPPLRHVSFLASRWPLPSGAVALPCVFLRPHATRGRRRAPSSPINGQTCFVCLAGAETGRVGPRPVDVRG
jgi:hypothetical protein